MVEGAFGEVGAVLEMTYDRRGCIVVEWLRDRGGGKGF